MGRNTRGVRGILIGKERQGYTNGYHRQGRKARRVYDNGKRTGVKKLWWSILKFRAGRAGGKSCDVTTKTGKVASSQIIPANAQEVIITSQKGQIVKLTVASIPRLSRATQA